MIVRVIGMESPAGRKGTVTIVVQTRVRPETTDAFAAWQAETGKTIAAFPGFVERTVMPPSPPAQVDWIILQRFRSAADAVAWLNSPDRQKLLQDAASMRVGPDDVHIVSDEGAGLLPSPVSVVMSTYVKPGQEVAYRAWERRITAVQSRASGFQGHRFEPPIPGVQEHWLSIVRFDTEENLQAWLSSPERQKLVTEASEFTARFRSRIARTGFDQWFPVKTHGAPQIAVWKQNMLVLLLLYPVVFLFSKFVQAPLLTGRAHLPFAIALFIGNIVTIVLLNYLVPWTSMRFSWWLVPKRPYARRLHLAGLVLLTTIYGIMLVAFLWLR
jgi:antibiotic biosynthesis monooxygenase (ABM) superfamily enzyme